jgi:two-component system response regulator HydG
MPDLELLSLRPQPASREAERLAQAARSAQRVVVVTAGVGAALEPLARQLHAFSPRAREALAVLRGDELDREELSLAAFERARRASLALLEPQLASASAQLRLAGRIRHWRRDADGAPRIYALFERDPAALAAGGRLQLELVEALDGLSLRLATLAERRHEIAPLARTLLVRHGADAARLTPRAAALLEQLAWPGGEAELELWLARALLLAGDGAIEAEHVAPPTPVAAARETAPRDQLPLRDRSLSTVEAALIERVLEEQGGNVSRCAAVLGIHRSTLHAKLRSLRRS